jgi:hypothetical protein
MTIQQLLDNLNKHLRHGISPDYIVKCFDADCGRNMPLTGFLIDSEDEVIELCTDDMGG